MGLFDFVRNIGKKVFHRDEEAAEKIKAEIESSNPGITGLNVNYDPASGKVRTRDPHGRCSEHQQRQEREYAWSRIEHFTPRARH